MKYFSLLSLSLALFSCDSYQASKSHINPPQVIETITLLGDTLTSPELKESKSYDQFKKGIGKKDYTFFWRVFLLHKWKKVWKIEN